MTTRALATPSARRALLTLTTVVATFALSGCAVLSPVQTDEPAQTADGIDVDLDDSISVRSLVIVASKQGEPGRVSAQVVNNSDSPVTVAFAVSQDSGGTVEVPAHTSANLADPDYAVTLPAVPVAPGDLSELQVSASTAGTNVYRVPVVLSEGYYAEVTPEPSASAS